MSKKEMVELKEGRPGSKVLVKGTVRTLNIEEGLVEVQFSTYSLWIPVADVIRRGE